MLGRFDGHTPPAILDANPAARALVHVLDGLQGYKSLQMQEYVAHYDPRKTDNIATLRKYVDEYEGEYRPDTPASSLECLWLHKGLIFGRKGTMKGLLQWLTCICGARRVLVAYEGPWPFLHFQTMEGGVLPNGEDLYNEKNAGFKIPTLLDNSWLIGYSRVTITIFGSYNTSAEFMQWLIDLLPRYLPMVDGQSLIPLIRFRP